MFTWSAYIFLCGSPVVSDSWRGLLVIAFVPPDFKDSRGLICIFLSNLRKVSWFFHSVDGRFVEPQGYFQLVSN